MFTFALSHYRGIRSARDGDPGYFIRMP